MSIRVHRIGPVATITLDRPAKRNALTLDMMRELGSALESIAEADDVRAVVLAGAGPSFCVGADVTEARLCPRLSNSFDECVTTDPIGPVAQVLQPAAVGCT